MPIQINLLAESQAAEEIRRRDPVKRAIWVAICVVVLVLVWSSSLQVKIMSENGKLSSLENKLNSKTNDYARVLDNQKKLVEIDGKLTSLNQMAAGRYLEANLLDAFMHSPADGVQINHLRTEQAYDITQDVKPAGSSSGKPGFSTQHIKLYIDARDASLTPGIVQVNKFKETLAHTAYFEQEKIGTNAITLKNISSLNFDNDTSKPFVSFSMECQYPERIH
jgi:hypothetical protein